MADIRVEVERGGEWIPGRIVKVDRAEIPDRDVGFVYDIVLDRPDKSGVINCWVPSKGSGRRLRIISRP